MIMDSPQIKRDTVILEGCQVNLSHYHVKDAEEDDIPPPLIHTRPTPHLGNYSCSLFNYILTPPPLNLYRRRLLLLVGKITNIYIQLE